MDAQDFFVEIMAKLNTSQINGDYEKLKEKLQKDPVIQNFVLNTATTDKAIKEVASNITDSLNMAFKDSGITGFELSVKDVQKMLTGGLKEATKEAEKLSSVVEKINSNLSGGMNSNYSTQITQLQSRFEKLGLTEDDVKQKMQGVNDAFEKLKNSSTNEQLIANNEAFKQSLTSTSNEAKNLKTNLDGVYNPNRQTNMSAQIQNWLTKNTAATRTCRDELNGYYDELNRGKVSVSRLDEIHNKFVQLDADMRSQNKLGSSFGDSIKAQAAKFSQWISVSAMVMKGVQEFKQGISFISELDSSLTNINYTMDVTKSQLQDVGNSSIKMAEDLNTSASNVLSAVKLYANANETTQTILEKARPAIMLSNVTGINGETSAKYLQTMMNQFDLTQDDLMGITDKIESISSNLSYDFSDGIVQMTEAISDSGSVAKAAGLNLQEYASMIGVLVEQTGQSGSTLGNSLKSIITRTTKASKVAGIDEGDISKAETALRSVGVEVRATDGDFREFNDTMSDLASKWDSLSDVEKSSISFQLAGTRQTAVLKTLVQNWQEVEDVAEKANNSSGETLKNQDIYAESLQGHLGSLKATGESVWGNMLNSDVLKDGVDSLENILSIISDITKLIGGWGSLGAGLGLFAGIKNIGKVRKCVHFQSYLF